MVHILHQVLPLVDGTPVCEYTLFHATGHWHRFWYPRTTEQKKQRKIAEEKKRSHREAPNSPRGVLLITKITAWFMLLLPTLDKLPDMPFWQCPAPDRGVVYGWYMEDRARDPGMWPNVSKPYFLRVWGKHCGQIKLRKHLRFANCTTCKSFKEQNPSSLAKKRRQEMEAHYGQVIRSRQQASYHASLALAHPEQYISIAQDGTDQLGLGYPSFAEKTCNDDNPKLTTKIMVNFVHGNGVYLLPIGVAFGPAESIECLQRTLKHEEKKRGGVLPRTLLLQFDNCFSENNNIYIMAYLSWLVERRVFDAIYLSFHPIGHTHNECDQCASRIYVATQHADIGCRCNLVDVLKGCYTPQPHIETVENVVNFMKTFNPESTPMPAANDIRRVHFFMFHRNSSGHVVMRERLDADVEQWSEPDLFFKEKLTIRPQVRS